MVSVEKDTMGRETGLDAMEHVADGFTLSVQELVHNLLMENGFVTVAERYCYAAVYIYIYMQLDNVNFNKQCVASRHRREELVKIICIYPSVYA